MQNAVWNIVIPLDRDHLQKRMNVCPAGEGQKDVVAVLAAVENIHTVKVKIDYVYLRMIAPKLIAEPIDIVAPAAVHEHQVFAVKVGYFQLILCRQAVMHGNCAAKRPTRQLKAGAAAQVQHSIVEKSADNVDVLAEIGQYLPCVFGGVFSNGTI